MRHYRYAASILHMKKTVKPKSGTPAPKAAPSIEKRSKTAPARSRGKTASRKPAAAAAKDQPVKLAITLTRAQTARLRRKAAGLNCSIEELLMRTIMGEDQTYLTTKAIAESTEDFKTGRYEP